MAKSSKPNLTPYAIVAVIIILLFMWWYSQTFKAPDKRVETEKITTENEFVTPLELPSVLSDEEARAREKFTFSVNSPLNGVTVKSPYIQVKGKTVPNADVFVNEKDGSADAQGNFSVPYTLDEGENYLVVGANDAYGNFNEVELMVYYYN